jgi:hypothetical protein
MMSFLRNLATFLPMPAESRNSFTSNAGLFEIAFRGKRRTFTDSRRETEDATRNNSMASTVFNIEHPMLTLNSNKS